MKQYLSFFLIPYLLVFINSKYVLVIDNTSFEFTLEENDVAKQFKGKFPKSITMSKEPNSLIYYGPESWTCFNPSTDFQSGYIDYNCNEGSIYIRFSSGSDQELNIGQINDPNKLKEYISKYSSININVLFTENNEEEEKEEEK